MNTALEVSKVKTKKIGNKHNYCFVIQNVTFPTKVTFKPSDKFSRTFTGHCASRECL